MKVEPKFAVLITGAGSGIGRAAALALGKAGANVTVAERSEKGGNETVELLLKQRQQIGGKVESPPAATFVKCDVAVPSSLANAFKHHIRTYGRLDICINNAGIGELGGAYLKDKSEDGSGSWRRVMDINLTAVIDGTRLAVHAMERFNQGRPGVIINVASASGFYPSVGMPIYSASKGGVVQFVRALGDLKEKRNIRVVALCPEYVDTALVQQGLSDPKGVVKQHIDAFGGTIPMEVLIEAMMGLIADDRRAGANAIMRITKRNGVDFWNPRNTPSAKGGAQGGTKDALKNRKLVIYKLSSQFRDATKIISEQLMVPPAKGAIIVRHVFAGVNASDVNDSAGRYAANRGEAENQLPFTAGFEAVGRVVFVGEGAKGFTRGMPVASFATGGGFAQYSEVLARLAIPVPEVSPAMVAMLTSGLTASIGLEQAGRMGTGETVLVTAAAGGTGQFAVQMAKLAGNTVIATCGGAQKAQLLKDLGVDRVIDYRQENVAQVLKREFPNGVDLIFESVGGDLFKTCLKALAKGGRLVVIGMMSQYLAEEGKGWALSEHKGLTEALMSKSQALVGFLVLHYAAHYKRHLARLHSLYQAGHLKVATDPSSFQGLESVADAVEHLHSGKSVGKVVVKIAEDEEDKPERSRL